jgi:hypothetical protein
VSSDAAGRPRDGWLWGMLALLVLVGTVASGFVVWAVLSIGSARTLLLYLPVAVAGVFVAAVSMLLLTGMLYRVDRLRGVPHREVRMFE